MNARASQKVAAKDFLKHYATRLNAVEINYTFRQLPKAATLENWVAATGDGFLFACKAHMRITHINRLKESEFTELFFKALEPLRAAGPLSFPSPFCPPALYLSGVTAGREPTTDPL